MAGKGRFYWVGEFCNWLWILEKKVPSFHSKGMIFADVTFVPDDKGELTALAAPIADAAVPLPPTTDVGMALIKMLLTLAALVILLYVTYWFIKRLIQNRLQKGVGQQTIQILEKRMISPKTMLYLVQVENKKILMAESHLEIKALETLPADLASTEE